MRRFYLIGPRACGKTTLGRLLAESLNAPCVDTDAVLAERLGVSIAEFVEANGWDRFREEEHLALRAVVERTEGEGTAVVSTGGGIVLLEKNRKLLKETGVVLYLSAPVEELVRRLTADPNAAQRPSLTGRTITDEVREVLLAREPLYRETASLVTDGSAFTPDSCQPLLNILMDKGLIPC